MASDIKYWLDLFTVETWEEFLKNGAGVSGFREHRRSVANRIHQGDYLICYLTGLGRFVGVLEVLSEAYFDDNTRIWGSEVFPVRFKVKLVYSLNARTAVPVLSIRDNLSIFRKLKNPKNWSGFFRGSPAEFKKEDGEYILMAVKQASKSPVERDSKEEPETSMVERRHEELKRKIKEIGETLGKYATAEFHSTPYIYDAIWKDTAGLPRPGHVFEVQDKGSVDSALAKLQHARDTWRPKLFLVVTGESDRNKVDALLRPFLQGTFHGISRDTEVLTGQVIDDLHKAFTEHRTAIAAFVQ
jgi:predicted RNA-binding protein